ncbi:MAG: type IV pilus assembly protein PilM [Fimbriimonadales bacterium]|nr:type IV pilus assembly protein PilM [Fimbriimonadales bacterium]
MAKRLTAAVGIDIGTQTIKTATIKATKDGYAITGLGIAPTPEGTVDHTGIFDAQTLGATLKGLVAMSSGGVKDAVFCINGQAAVVVRILEVPRMSDTELADHMQWEIQRNIPFAETNVVSDFRPIDNPALANTQNMEVVMAVSPRSAIETVMTLVRSAGCKPAAIDVEALGLARVIKTCHYNDLGIKNACFVHMGHSTTSINMYRSGVLAFPRTVPLGGSMLTKAISDGLGLTMAEAESRKVTQGYVPATAAGGGFGAGPTMVTPYNPFSEQQDTGEDSGQDAGQGMGGGEGDAVYQAMAGTLEEFTAEIRRSIDYFKSRGGDVEMIGMSGGGANLKGMVDYVNRSLGIPTVKVDPFANIAVMLPAEHETLRQNNASEFATAIGMALHIAYD